jgi:hypothetical protein
LDSFAGGLRVELFQADKVADLAPSESTRKCRLCGEKLVAVRAFVDAATGHVIQTFECECGERIWDD